MATEAPFPGITTSAYAVPKTTEPWTPSLSTPGTQREASYERARY
ncbi:54S ribosomal protein YmL6 [Colletotrichum higginsianum]|uniref:54S ribosomal protein YmL6 n=1 Tax=Colletotrichum higginsianum (strain IMI 349063) TaxID=759273 RepID=H1VXK6_COLHI|nr:54S ribosomal protein YmL6 [Colletotrichum higginsianum]